jgi:hypothetical protein
MENDSETEYIKGLARIKSVEASIEVIKSQLAHKVNDVQLQSLQKQITSLSESLLQTRRALAYLDIEIMRLHMNRAIRQRLQSPTKERAREYIDSEYGKAMEAIKNSPKPLTVAREFRDECVKYSQQYKLDAFMD